VRRRLSSAYRRILALQKISRSADAKIRETADDDDAPAS
jgi:hypothetical protein